MPKPFFDIDIRNDEKNEVTNEEMHLFSFNIVFEINNHFMFFSLKLFNNWQLSKILERKRESQCRFPWQSPKFRESNFWKIDTF